MTDEERAVLRRLHGALFAYGFLSESLQTFLVCWLVAGVVALGTVGWWLHSKAEWSK